MNYDHKIIDLKYHLKGLINKNTCKELINFYEANKNLAELEASYKFNERQHLSDNCNFLNLSQNTENDDFKKPYELIIQYLKIVLTNYEMYVRSKLCPTFEIHQFMKQTNNIRIIKYEVGQSIKDHTDASQNVRGSLTINLNDDYEGGEFRFFGGRVKLNLIAGEAMLFPAEPIWIHGTEPVTKGARYAINCFLRQ
jgi:predicted 2-oxoglutarate/Fe(II)-dependent dioxygenase YbiX|tara:strand:+ start:43 stop:630 length:588 start_codon:yes stop_codon:yes gene_type:complete